MSAANDKGFMIRDDRFPLLNTVDVFKIGKALAQAHFMGARNAAEGVLALKVIQEVGAVRANERYHLMMGRLSKRADAICADFLKAGGTYKIIRRDADCAELVASYGDTKDMTFRVTWEDAQEEPFVYAGNQSEQLAELEKPRSQRKIQANYLTPRKRMQMLWARLVSDMGRALCPQACEGMYPPEVVKDFAELNCRPSVPSDASNAPDGPDTSGTINAEYTVEDDEGATDYTRCPFGEPGGEWFGKKWTEFDEASLNRALESDLSYEHKAEIRKVLDAWS